MLSPSGDVSVCPGSQLSFRCSTNLPYLEWDITVFQSGIPETRTQLLIPATQLGLDIINEAQCIVFNITKNNSYPLISVLTIAKAVADINATKIKCTEIEILGEKNSSVGTIKNFNTLCSYGHIHGLPCTYY